MEEPGDTREMDRKVGVICIVYFLMALKVTLHRMEIPVAMKDAAVMAADVAMNKYTIEKAHI